MSELLERQLAEQRIATLEMQLERDDARLAAITASERVLELERPRVTSSLNFTKHALETARKEFSEKYPSQEPPK